MRYSNGIFAFLAAAGLVVSSAHAQSIPGVGSAGNAMSGMSGMSGMTDGTGMMSSMLPNISSASTGNVAGVLTYCVQNNYLSGSGATSALSSLTGKQGVTSSSDYTAGQQGQLLTGGSNAFSLSSLKGQMKQKVCNMVLSHAKNLL
ncbi:YjjA family protein [Gluconobacter sphaericus]|uniref:YjjA family protein n=1 Tax=Gluconobacter sphaericus TaxID=574987 RepID=UPI001F3D7C1C|nr:YjjA family protein [Gluconobacter sphaericus]